MLDISIHPPMITEFRPEIHLFATASLATCQIYNAMRTRILPISLSIKGLPGFQPG